MNPAPEEPAAQSPEHRCRYIGTHHHIQPFRRQGLGEIGGQSGGQGLDKDPLKETRPDQDPKARCHRTDETPEGHSYAAGENDRTDGELIGQKAKGKIGDGDAKDDSRHAERCHHHVRGKLALQDRQYRLSDVNICKRGRNQRKDDEFQPKGRMRSHAYASGPQEDGFCEANTRVTGRNSPVSQGVARRTGRIAVWLRRRGKPAAAANWRNPATGPSWSGQGSFIGGSSPP